MLILLEVPWNIVGLTFKETWMRLCYYSPIFKLHSTHWSSGNNVATIASSRCQEAARSLLAPSHPPLGKAWSPALLKSALLFCGAQPNPLLPISVPLPPLSPPPFSPISQLSPTPRLLITGHVLRLCTIWCLPFASGPSFPDTMSMPYSTFVLPNAIAET